MRAISIAAVLAAACGADPVPMAIDAAAVDALSVDSAPGVDAPPGPPGPLDGRWSLTWECLGSCQLAEPPLTHSHRLDVASTQLEYSDLTCVECVALHSGAFDDPNGSIAVAAATEELHERRRYVLTRAGDTVSAEVTWVPRFGPPVDLTWRLRGELAR